MKVIASIEFDRKKQLGVGLGMNSIVYEIDEPQLGGRMAVKEIAKADLCNDVDAYFVESQAVFDSAHANVVPIQYACATNDSICLVMPLFSKGTVAERIKTGPLLESEAVRIAISTLAGLGHIHARGYVHFDIKPSNIMLSDHEEPMVADFGQARRMTALGVAQPSAVYETCTPPEVIEHGVGSLHADIYQVGLLLYRMVNGDPYWKSQVPDDLAELQRRTRKGKFPDRGGFVPHVHPRIRTLIRKALQVDPADRFQSAAEFRSALGRIVVENAWTVTHLPSGARTWRCPREGQPDLVVELVAENGTWSTAVFTERAGLRRARNPGSFSRKGLTLGEAEKHLTGVFRSL